MKSAILILTVCTAVLTAPAQDGLLDIDESLSLSGALCLYYSGSILSPPDNQRAYTTQPARSGTIAVDLATFSLGWRTRSAELTIGLQAGTWADANYVGLDEGWRYVREASVKFNFDSTVWVVGGLFPSHIGHESSINAENMLLSRSMNADLTPYYVAGAGVAFTPTSTFKAVVYVLNGWQKVVDNNDQLSFGSKVDWTYAEHSTVSWNTYVGNDEPIGAARLRIHNNFWLDHAISETVRAVLMGDVSMLENRATGGMDVAWYAAVKGGWRFTQLFRLGARVEYMNDPDNVLALSGPAFQTVGASLGLDVFPMEHILLRSEVRSLNASEAVFPSSTGNEKSDLFFTIAIAAQL